MWGLSINFTFFWFHDDDDERKRKKMAWLATFSLNFNQLYFNGKTKWMDTYNYKRITFNNYYKTVEFGTLLFISPSLLIPL